MARQLNISITRIELLYAMLLVSIFSSINFHGPDSDMKIKQNQILRMRHDELTSNTLTTK